VNKLVEMDSVLRYLVVVSGELEVELDTYIQSARTLEVVEEEERGRIQALHLFPPHRMALQVLAAEEVVRPGIRMEGQGAADL
jgi:hypothetical protein